MMMIMVVVLQMAADEFITMAIEAFQIMDATKLAYRAGHWARIISFSMSWPWISSLFRYHQLY